MKWRGFRSAMARLFANTKRGQDEGKKRGVGLPTPLLYQKRPKERPIAGDQRCRCFRGLPPLNGWGRDSLPPASGPDRPACSVDCKKANQATPSAPVDPSCSRKWDNLPCSSECQSLDFEPFDLLGLFGDASPLLSDLPALPLEADESAAGADFASSALAALL